LAEKIDRAVFPGIQGGPHNNAIAAKALAFFNALHPKFKQYQKQVVGNAKILADTLKELGFDLVTGGTDTHLILINLKNFKISGLRAEKLLENSGITANRNTILGDKSPLNPSGLRLGTPAVTARGMKEKEMKKIGELIYQCLIKNNDVSKEVRHLCTKFPLEY
jgi:glycine hydroxymethyltransferase